MVRQCRGCTTAVGVRRLFWSRSSPAVSQIVRRLVSIMDESSDYYTWEQDVEEPVFAEPSDKFSDDIKFLCEACLYRKKYVVDDHVRRTLLSERAPHDNIKVISRVFALMWECVYEYIDRCYEQSVDNIKKKVNAAYWQMLFSSLLSENIKQALTQSHERLQNSLYLSLLRGYHYYIGQRTGKCSFRCGYLAAHLINDFILDFAIPNSIFSISHLQRLFAGITASEFPLQAFIVENLQDKSYLDRILHS